MIGDVLFWALMIIILPMVAWFLGYMFFRGGVSGIVDFFTNAKIKNNETEKEK